VGRANCGHEFYKDCIDNLIKAKGSCPGCKPKGEGIKPKALASTAGEQPTSGTDAERIANIVAQQLKAMQNDLLTQLTERMGVMIQTKEDAEMQEPLRPAESSHNFRVSSEIGDIDIPDRPISAFSSSDLGSRPGKIGQIISSWKLRFNGDQDGLSEDKFLYRVEELTRETLNLRFGLLCGNACVLFEGKAREYYWRFHKVSDSSRWDSLTEALRKQFRDTRTDVDLRETIRDRKQKEKDSFEAFYDHRLSESTDGKK